MELAGFYTHARTHARFDLLITHISPLVCVWVVVGQSNGEGDAVLVHQGKQHADG